MKKNIEDLRALHIQQITEKNEKLNQYMQKHNIKYSDTITSNEHPEYFKITEEYYKKWLAVEQEILKFAKYKVGQVLQFSKKNIWWENSYTIERIERVLSKGVVTEIKVSHNGDILYFFETLEPPCPETNPYCVEPSIISVIETKITNNYSFAEFLLIIYSLTLTEEKSKELLEEIYPDSYVFCRKEMRTPIWKSYKKRLIKNIGNAWYTIDLEKLDNCFKKCGLNLKEN